MLSYSVVFFLAPLLNSLLVLSQSFTESPNRKENTTLLLVQALFRHGERAPLFTYKNDPNAMIEWPGGMGKLTRLGKHHHYAIGKFLRYIYKDFLTSDPKEVLMNSSAVDRCLRGAEVTLASLYEPEGPWKFEEDLNWQPIPIFYLPVAQDKYLSPESDCPRGFIELERIRNSEEFQELNREHQKMIEEVSNFIEMDVSEEFQALFLGDTLRVEKLYNLTFPTLIDNYYEEILEYGDATFSSFYGSDLILRLRVGPLLQGISENMKRKINGEIPDLKIHLYSTQDVIVASVLNALNLTYMPRPPNCATLLFELYEMADATMAVRLLYLNSSDPITKKGELHTLILDDCSEFCPLENFTNKFQHLIPEDWEQECEKNTSNDNQSVQTLVIVFSVIACFSLISLVGVFLYSKKKIEETDKISSKRIAQIVVRNVPE